jgi:serine/threonine protein kinase
MRLVGCKSLAQTFELFQDAKFYYMVNEPYYGGDFQTLRPRAEAQGVSLTEDWWRKVFRQCLRALEFMHSQAMIHCDIKEPNLMLRTADFAEPEVVVVDFGLSKAMGAGESGVWGGTPGYIPPETILHRKWFPGGDIFSLGVVIYQMLTNSSPEDQKLKLPVKKGLFLVGCKTMDEVKSATSSRQPAFHVLPCYPGLEQLSKGLLEKQLSKRLRPLQALDTEFIRGPLAEEERRGTNNSPPCPASPPLRSKHRMATAGDMTGLLGSLPEVAEEPDAKAQDSLVAEEGAASSQAPAPPRKTELRSSKPRATATVLPAQPLAGPALARAAASSKGLAPAYPAAPAARRTPAKPAVAPASVRQVLEKRAVNSPVQPVGPAAAAGVQGRSRVHVHRASPAGCLTPPPPVRRSSRKDSIVSL